MKERFKFSHRSADGLTYYWHSVHPIPGDSRVAEIRCNVAWFWRKA